jgi:hypothetical protein
MAATFKGIKLADADKVGEPTEERFTAFNSHGARFYRLTADRATSENLETDMNRFSCQVYSDGSRLYTPVRELIEVPSKAPVKPVKTETETA